MCLIWIIFTLYLHVTSPNKSPTYYKSFLLLQDLCRSFKSVHYKLFRQWVWIHVKYYFQLKAWCNLANSASFLLNPIKYPLTSYRKRLDSFFLFFSSEPSEHQGVDQVSMFIFSFYLENLWSHPQYSLPQYSSLSIHLKLDHKRLYYKQLISCSYSLFGKTFALDLLVKRFSQLIIDFKI